MSKKNNNVISKYRDVILYIVFGVATTLVNWIIYTVTSYFLKMTISNIIAWFISVIFAYIVNKLYVFESKSWEIKNIAKEVFLFFAARFFSGIIEVGALPLLVNLGLNQQVFDIEGSVAKIIISVIVVLSNFIFSKLVVFRKKNNYVRNEHKEEICE